MKKTIKFKDYCVLVKWGKKYIWPSYYKETYYSKGHLPKIISQIEKEYPQYKGKMVIFERCIVST